MMKPTRHELQVRDLEEVASRIASTYCTTIEAMFSRDRTARPAAARRAFYAHLRGIEGWPLESIGALVGRHWTTVRHELLVLDREARARAGSVAA